MLLSPAMACALSSTCGSAKLKEHPEYHDLNGNTYQVSFRALPSDERPIARRIRMKCPINPEIAHHSMDLVKAWFEGSSNGRSHTIRHSHHADARTLVQLYSIFHSESLRDSSIRPWRVQAFSFKVLPGPPRYAAGSINVDRYMLLDTTTLCCPDSRSRELASTQTKASA
jgi:hypothetical protein